MSITKAQLANKLTVADDKQDKDSKNHSLHFPTTERYKHLCKEQKCVNRLVV